MKVRFAQEKDVDKILELLLQVNRVHADLRPDLFLVGTKYDQASLWEMLSDKSKLMFVCVNDEDMVLGYGLCAIEDFPNVEIRTNIKSIYIDDICVDETCRRMGVATTVYEAILEYAKNNGFYNVTLNVWEGNTGAETFYRNMGMKTQKTTMETIL